MYGWLFVLLLVAAAVSGLLGFVILRDVRKGLAKGLFYIFICAALLVGFFWLMTQPPETVL